MKDNISEEEIRKAFRVFDEDEKGFISVSDFRHIMTKLGEKLTPEEVNDFIKEANVDDNGFINFNQLVSIFNSR